jgi:hypothetical protein
MVHFSAPWFMNNIYDIEDYIKNSFNRFENSEVVIIGKNTFIRGIFGSSNEFETDAIAKWINANSIEFPVRISVRIAGMYCNSNILSAKDVFGPDEWLFAIQEYVPEDFIYVENFLNDYDHSWERIPLNNLAEYAKFIQPKQGIEFIVWVNQIFQRNLKL